MNYSDEQTQLTAIRCAGVNGPNPGERFGGTYFPPVLNPDGSVKTSGRWVGAFYINRKGRRNEDGTRTEGRREIISLTVWNNRGNKEGKGLADLFAKCVSEGKELTCRAQLHTYDAPVKNIDGSVVMRSDGKGPLTMRRTGYTLEPGSLLLSDDSRKIVDREIAAFDGHVGYSSRPAGWDDRDPNHADRVAWKQISDWRMAQQFVPGPTYGYAKVGATAAAAPGAINAANVAAAVDTVAAGGQKLVFPGATAAAGADDDPF